MRYVIIGGGIAGITAAEQLRKADKEAEITVVSEEASVLYSRVLLPHYIKEKVPRERVFLKKETWYAEQNIERLAPMTVERIDTKNRHVELSDKRELPYDKLLIATGGDLRTLPATQRGVTYLHSLDDADYIVQLLNEQQGSAIGGIYGGGFIACEFVNIFEHFGIPTTIAFRGDHFWNSILEPEAGKFINEHMVKGGVTVVPNAELKEVLGEKDVEGFVTSKGTHHCSILGVGVGHDNDLSWLEGCGVECDSGIFTDEYLQTSVEDVFAAGDITSFNDVTVGRRRRVGNWMNAMTQGRIVAKNLLGEEAQFELVSSYATNVLGLEIIFVGDASKAAADSVIVHGTAEQGGVVQLFEREGVLVGAVLIGRNTDRAAVTKMIKNKESASEFVFVE